MLNTWGGRVAAITVLLAVLFALMVGFGSLSPAPALGDYPDEDALAKAPEAHVGETVQLSGAVSQTDPVAVRVQYDYYADGERAAGSYRLTIRGVDTPVERGDSLQVFGTVESDGTIQAQSVVVVPPANYAYMYGISALAGLWVLARLVRGWSLDWETGALERRNQPAASHRTLGARLREVFD